MTEDELFGPEFLIRRPLLEAIDSDEQVVLLIDEIDRADEEFEAFLLEVLSDFQITIPEIGTIETRRRPVVLLTSNRTRELHDALKRRTLFHWIGHPSLEREVEIVRLRVPGIPERLAQEAAAFVRELRGLDLAKPPGVAETIDWAQALAALGRRELDAEVVEHARRRPQEPRGRRSGAGRVARRPRRRGARGRRALNVHGTEIVRHVVAFGRVLARGGPRGRTGTGRRRDPRSRRGRPRTAGGRLFHPAADARLTARRPGRIRPRLHDLVPATAARALAGAARRAARRRSLGGATGRRERRPRAGRGRARGVLGRAPAPQGLRGDVARGAGARSAGDRRDRPGPPGPPLPPPHARPARRLSRRSSARPPLAPLGRGSGRAPAPRPEGRSSEARRPLRHLRLDERVRARGPALPACGGRDRGRRRGFRVRHAADTAYARFRPAGSRGRARTSDRGRARLGLASGPRSASCTTHTAGEGSRAARSS